MKHQQEKTQMIDMEFYQRTSETASDRMNHNVFFNRGNYLVAAALYYQHIVTQNSESSIKQYCQGVTTYISADFSKPGKIIDYLNNIQTQTELEQHQEIPRFVITDAEPTDNDLIGCDVLIQCSENIDEQAQCSYYYDSKKFGEAEIEIIDKRILSIARYMIEHPEAHLSEIELIEESEKSLVLKQFNNTTINLGESKTIVQIFTEQAGKTPERIAVEFKDQKLSYQELNQKANYLGKELHDTGIKQNEIVAVITERSLEMMIGIFGILKAGCAYLPITPDMPVERMKYILANSGARAVLIGPGAGQLLRSKELFSEGTILLDLQEIKGSLAEAPIPYVQPDSLAYVIYTSGTTGNPKGVMVQNDNLVNLLTWMMDEGFTKDDAILFKTSFTFDLSIWEVFLWCICGARVVLLPPGEEQEPDKIAEAIEKYNITRTSFVPSVLEEFVPYMSEFEMPSLKKIQLSGEALPVELANKFNKISQGQVTLINSYGPTECTVFATSWEVPTKAEITDMHIGKPLANTQVYILKNQKLCGVGVAGEIFIGGDGVSRGYLNNPQLTSEKFVPDPFNEGKRMYATGDLGRWNHDGRLVYLGRIDHQVKIRGHRIELGEIESRIKEIAEIDNAVVLALGEGANKNLCAYYVAQSQLEPDWLRGILQVNLPDYMIPAHFVWVERFPVTSNGKLDRRSLASIPLQRRSIFKPARNQLEQKLIGAFEAVLQINGVGISDDFMELGGHSLKATRLSNMINKLLSVRLSIKTILECKTVEKLAEYIKGSQLLNDSEPIGMNHLSKYPMSSVQKRLFLIEQLGNAQIAYNIPIVFKTKQNFDFDKLEQALNKVIQQHSIFRTKFEISGDAYIQTVIEDCSLKLGYKRIDKAKLNDEMKAFVRPFDLGQAPLLRACVFDSGSDIYLAFDLHHIVYDEGCEQILVRDLNDFYNGSDVSTDKFQYIDYCVWQETRDLSEQREYWNNLFAVPPVNLNLKTDYPRPKFQSHNGENVISYFNSDFKNQLKSFCQSSGTTEYMVLLAAFMLLLNKYTQQNDIVVGTPMAGRGQHDLENIMGMFVNTVPIRGQLDESEDFGTWLGKVKERCLEGYANQEYPFEQLVEDLKLPRDTARNPLFDVMFVMQNNDSNELKLGEASFDREHFHSCVAAFDLTVSITQSDEGYRLQWEYCTDLFKPETIGRLAEHYQVLLNHILTSTSTVLKEIPYISDIEKDKVLFEFNQTEMPYPDDKTIVELFEKQVQEKPEQLAVTFYDQQLTYQQLNQKANALGRLLRNKGAKPDNLVAIMMGKSIENIVAIYGVIKSGAAYMPIMPDCPTKRLEYLLADSGCKILIKGPGCQVNTNTLTDIEVIDMNDVPEFTGENLPLVNKPSDMAYVIYTSGSTGKPKGVMVEHRNVINMALWQADNGDYQETTTMVQKTTFIFDGHVWEVFPAGLAGICLDIINEEDGNDLEKLTTLLNGKQVFLIPSMFRMLLNYLEVTGNKNGLKFDRLYLAAEALTKDIVEKYKKEIDEDISNVYNLYGPTECTVCVTGHHFSNGDDLDAISIGKPIYNTNVYIMNDYELCGIGVPGEICIGGANVARGYLNNPELTAEKFVINPHTNERIYRTGDIGCWLEDGSIFYISRRDDQIKYRGIRIELGEIESVFREMPAVSDVVVLINKDNVNELLCAYVVADCEQWDESQARLLLAERLPQYMVPPYIIRLDEFPRTGSEKIDKKALPIPEISNEKQYAAPENELEHLIVDGFKEILGLEHIGATDDFFELGGHSLKAMNMVIYLERKTGKKVSMRDIMHNRTARELAALLGEKADLSAIVENIPRLAASEHYQLNSAQKRLFAIDQMQGENIIYNTPIRIDIEGDLVKESLSAAFNQLIERHETLRTSFILSDGEFVQTVAPAVEFELLFETVAEADVEKICKDFVVPFDLAKAPLLRAKVLEVSDGKYILIMDIHHIICDGSSVKILLDDLSSFYNGQTLTPLAVQNKDISAWQVTRDIKTQQQYWQNEFATAVEPLNLITDYPRPQTKSFNGKDAIINFDSTLKDKIVHACQSSGITEATFFLSSFMVLLSNYSRQEELVVGIPSEGRIHSQMKDVLGMFVNTLPIRSQIDKNISFDKFCQAVQDKFLQVIENQEYPYEKLIEMDGIEINPSRNPLIDVMLAFQNTEKGNFRLSGCQTKVAETENQVAKFDLLLNIDNLEDCYKLTWEYATDLFKADTIIQMAAHFTTIVEQVCTQMNKQVGNITLFSQTDLEMMNRINAMDLKDTKNHTILDYFNEQVQLRGNQPAIRQGKKVMTYEEVDQKSNQLARTLMEWDIQKEELIGIVGARNIETIIGLLAILKTGGGYLPIDANAPVSRIEYILNDSNCQLVLTSERDALPEISRLDNLDLLNSKNYHADASALNIDISPSDLAHVIYTSGTTGNPKGVMIEHRNVNRLVKDGGIMDIEAIKLIPTGSLAFDASTLEIWGVLLNGGELCLVDNDAITDVKQFGAAIKEYQINTLFLTTALFHQFVDTDASIFAPLSHLLTGGEQLSQQHVEKLLNSHSNICLSNLYGPTECTTVALMYPFKDKLRDSIAIGTPISQTQAYIMQDGKQCGVDIPGELYLGGEGLARGYLNRVELTAEKFVPSPFREGEKLYRTGDLVRLAKDGQVEFLGRIDSQVKIRGYRIELQEIENQIKQLSSVRDAIVIVKGEQGAQQLVAYVILAEDIVVTAIQSELEEILPEYMMPNHIVQLTEFPMTNNGKLDTKALPEVSYQERKEYVAPRNDYEEGVAKAFCEIFEIDKISVDEDFFKLGGHSLMAAKLVNLIERYSQVRIQIREVLKEKTVENIAAKVEKYKQMNRMTSASIMLAVEEEV